MTDKRHVLVLGGSGALGGALLAELRDAGIEASFTFHGGDAQRGAHDAGHTAYGADLRDPHAIPALFDELARAGRLPQAVVHCAGIAPAQALADITLGDWDDVHAIHGRAALQCAQQMAARRLRGSLVLVAALDGVQPVPAPAHYAASQAALWGLTQALAKELGPGGILVNLALVGVLDGGIAAALAPDLRAAYRRHAALARTGTCAEAARALRWLALENTYLNGAQFPVTGGLG